MLLGSIRLYAAGLAALPLMAQDRAQERAIGTQRSTITIHVGESGLLSAAAHDHTINAPISSGSLRESLARTLTSGRQARRSAGTGSGWIEDARS